MTVLGEETGLESHVGVVNGEAGPWAVAVHLAKATLDDVVIPAAKHRRAVGSPDGNVLASENGPIIPRRWTTRALEFTTEGVASLETVPGQHDDLQVRHGPWGWR